MFLKNLLVALLLIVACSSFHLQVDFNSEAKLQDVMSYITNSEDAKEIYEEIKKIDGMEDLLELMLLLMNDGVEGRSVLDHRNLRLWGSLTDFQNRVRETYERVLKNPRVQQFLQNLEKMGVNVNQIDQAFRNMTGWK